MHADGRQLDWRFGPVEALGRWPASRRAVLLHSGRFDPRWARWSLLAEPVGSFRFISTADRVGQGKWLGPADASPAAIAAAATHPLTALRDLLTLATPGVWVGYLSYDLGRWVERLPEHARDDRGWPVCELGWCPGYLLYDGAEQRWYACGAWRDSGEPVLSSQSPAVGTFDAGEPVSVFTYEQYLAAAQRCLGYIAAGDVFQVNLAQRFTAPYRGDYPHGPRATFARLADVSPAWYGAYLELAPSVDALDAPGRCIASTSPELFLQVNADRLVITRPIKGTRPAYADPAELRRSEKDTAELNMIVDLMRNDLGRVCAYGTVRVDEARAIESHPTVHHGVATITGRLHPSKDVADLLRATMPGGSVTGAPKVRAMQIIDELEPVRRGPYCGCIGVLSPQFTCLNIAIRTMQLDTVAGRVDFSVGGGIVADSTPQAEYDETIDKAQAMLRTLRGQATSGGTISRRLADSPSGLGVRAG